VEFERNVVVSIVLIINFARHMYRVIFSSWNMFRNLTLINKTWSHGPTLQLPNGFLDNLNISLNKKKNRRKKTEHSDAMIEKGITSCHRKKTELRLY